MTPADIHALVLAFGGLGLGAVIALCVALVLLQYYVPAYIGEKGKNLATREDIAAITHEVERVRVEYSGLVEELKARHQLRLAALDRRLQAHQEAFTHWRKLISGPAQSDSAVLACQAWWEENCLYLEPTVRQAFVAAYTNAHLRNEFVQVRAESQLITEAWANVMAFPDILFAAVQLPPMSELEAKSIKANPAAQADSSG